jgi:hypothetical protein
MVRYLLFAAVPAEGQPYPEPFFQAPAGVPL